jgi:subtilisin family serine protease
MKVPIKLFLITISLIFINNHSSFSQVTNFKHDFLLENVQDESQLAISLTKSKEVIEYLNRKSLTIKKTTSNWVFLTINGKDLKQLLASPIAKFLYTEINEPILLNDTSRVHHQVNEVHKGLNNLQQAYTGKGVILGFIDTGLDFTHPDFKDSTGKTRVYSYWDQTIKTATSRSPKPYNYGEDWTATEINNGQCSAVDNLGHGTHVVGIAAGNGLANGKHKGMAPEATIVMVKTNNTAKNWTLTVADACDYIFKIADQLDKPCVINISYGVAMGSHDGNDPASEMIESLLDAKPGRIVVAAAGNNGNSGKYHVHGDVTSDTSFFWVKSTVKGIAGNNSILLEMWADSLKFKDVQFATGVNLPAGNYSLRGKTKFRTFLDALNASPNSLRDTIFNENGIKLAYVDYYAEIMNHEYHLQTAYTSIDSTDYLFQFMTTGSGSFDVWSGSANKVGTKNFNDFETINIPKASVYPSIVHYMMADTLQTIFSSYISSEKVMTVGNVSNKASYTTKDQILHLSDYKPGEIHLSSSKGPNRKGITKPDIVASGTKIFSANPFVFLNNPINNTTLDEGGYHALNSGTSMASPLVAGIAALYLEKCSKSNYQDFKNDAKLSAKTNLIQGKIPNNAYGNGEINALNLLLSTNPIISVLGDTVLPCSDSTTLTISSNKGLNSITWEDLDTKTLKTFKLPGKYPFKMTDTKNCSLKDTIIIFPRIPFNPSISFLDSSKISCIKKDIRVITQGGKSYSWSGGTNQQNDTVTFQFPGKYIVTISDTYGCIKRDSIEILTDTISPKITFQKTDDFTINCYQKSVQLKVNGAKKYIWGGQKLLNTSDSATYLKEGIYSVVGEGINGCKSSKTFEIFKDTILPIISKTFSNPPMITCKNKTVSITLSGATKYQWNDGNSPTTFSNSFIKPGVYYFNANNTNGCIVKDSVEILSDTVPNKSFLLIKGLNKLNCINKRVSIQASGGDIYAWNGGTSIHTDTNSFIIGGNYTVLIEDSKGCKSQKNIYIEEDFKSPTISINFLTSPYITCDNEPVKVKTVGAVSYIWNGGKYLNKDSNTFSDAGKYNVTAIGQNGCITKDSIAIERHFYPTTPTISQLDSLLIASTSPNYQWYAEGNLLKNETKQSIVFQFGKTYFVSVESNGCIASSKFYTPQLSSLQNQVLFPIHIFPNPTSTGKFSLDGLQENDQLYLSDLLGNNIGVYKVGLNEFQVENVANGVYLLTITRNSERMLVKIIKN